jgi:hypothetical protein
MTPRPSPPGWYQDPAMGGSQRYWDGTRWTEHVAPPAASAPPVQSMGLGYALAVLLPVVGLIYGLVKWRVGGPPVVVASIVAWIVWGLVLLG